MNIYHNMAERAHWDVLFHKNATQVRNMNVENNGPYIFFSNGIIILNETD